MSEILTVDEFYGEGFKGRLVGLECEKGHLTVPPRHSCGTCSSQTLTRIELSGRGKILSFTEVFVKSREFPIDAPYILAIVQLEEGGKLIGVVKSDDLQIAHGANVTVEFRKLNESEWPRIFFRLA